MRTPSILITRGSADYELIDSGEGEKLERFGLAVMRRPDPQALWPKRLPEDEWKKADAYFTRDNLSAGLSVGKQGDKAEWSFKKPLPADGWPIDFGGLKMTVKPTAFKHTGLFPEQSPNWDWMRGLITAAAGSGRGDIEVLNLFGYTGGASLSCAQAGANVVHIDSSKSAVTWARENAEKSSLADKPIRWIVEDARAFVERELKRGRSYDAIIMDPPAFGRGADNELWKIEDHFLPFVEDCKRLLKPKPLFFLINGYSAGYSAIAYENNLLSLKEKLGGEIEIGELAIEETRAPKHPARLLPAGIFARWNG